MGVKSRTKSRNGAPANCTRLFRDMKRARGRRDECARFAAGKTTVPANGGAVQKPGSLQAAAAADSHFARKRRPRASGVNQGWQYLRHTTRAVEFSPSTIFL
jgi:hypothetical protein